MEKWEEFELQCVNYFNKKFGEFAKFTHLGGPDSTVADIFVKTISKNAFYIDVKHSPAQCGQFVLLPDFNKKEFIYSPKNAKPENKYSENIKKYMNLNFDTFSNVGTAGLPIDSKFEKEFIGWIIEHYKNLGCKFIITNNYKIFQLKDLPNFFNVSAIYRIKKSGSGKVSNSVWNNIKTFLMKEYSLKTNDFDDFNFAVKLHTELEKQKFEFDNNEYIFSPKDYGLEVRRLSKTNNANVIFTVGLKDNTEKYEISDEDFIHYLKQ